MPVSIRADRGSTALSLLTENRIIEQNLPAAVARQANLQSNNHMNGPRGEQVLGPRDLISFPTGPDLPAPINCGRGTTWKTGTWLPPCDLCKHIIDFSFCPAFIHPLTENDTRYYWSRGC